MCVVVASRMEFDANLGPWSWCDAFVEMVGPDLWAAASVGMIGPDSLVVAFAEMLGLAVWVDACMDCIEDMKLSFLTFHSSYSSFLHTIVCMPIDLYFFFQDSLFFCFLLLFSFY